MASRTGANGVDIDGRHQFIDYSLWQASRFEWSGAAIRMLGHDVTASQRGSAIRSEPSRKKPLTAPWVLSERKTGVKHAEVITARLLQDERGWLRLAG